MLWLLSFQFALSLLPEVRVPESLQLESFNGSLNARLLHIPTSKYPSELDEIYEIYIESFEKGNTLLCKIFRGQAPESQITTDTQVEQSGWVRKIKPAPDNSLIADFSNAFQYLGLRYNENLNKFIAWEHLRRKRNAAGVMVPVCVFRLY
jgi:hypothetical protein